jgi:hypothetical protein
MNEIIFDYRTSSISAFDRNIISWCSVRNELNGKRLTGTKAAYSTKEDGTKGWPVMPRVFPIGKWKIIKIISHPDPIKDHYLYPFFILTNAFQELEVWDVDQNDNYLYNYHKMVNDYFYGLHFSDEVNTFGCIRIGFEADLRWLVGKVQTLLYRKIEIPFIVR